MTTLSEETESTVNAEAADSAETPPPESKAKGTSTQEESEAAAIDEASDDEPSDDEPSDDEPETRRRPIAWSRVLAYGVLPALALVLALVAGYFRWVVASVDELALARAESVRVASEDAAALLSYKADSADKDLNNAARDRLTGDFKDAYINLIRQVVIPGAKEKHISAVAKINAAASVSAGADHAVVLLYVDQTVTIGDGAPTDTQPVVRVALDKVNGRWLVSHFDPV